MTAPLRPGNPETPDLILKDQLPADLDIAETLEPELVLLAQTLIMYEKRRDRIELEMKKLARQLPVYPWAKGVAGLGEIGLAVIVGEAGDLSSYRNIRGLWRRLGLAPFEKNGETRAMSRWHSELDADDWVECGYNKKRRAKIYACVGESLGKHQLGSAAKAGTDFAIAKAEFGEIYVARRNRCILAGWVSNPRSAYYGDFPWPAGSTGFSPAISGVNK